MRRAARTDATHAAVVQAFEAMGCAVLDLSRVGAGCPDLLVARGGRMVLVEVKDGAKAASRRQLTPAQVVFHDRWPGPVVIVARDADVADVVWERLA